MKKYFLVTVSEEIILRESAFEHNICKEYIITEKEWYYFSPDSVRSKWIECIDILNTANYKKSWNTVTAKEIKEAMIKYRSDYDNTISVRELTEDEVNNMIAIHHL